MFKHPTCGGTHETVNEARQCERTNGAIRNHLQTPDNRIQPVAEDEVWPWAGDANKGGRPAAKPFEQRNRTKGDLNKPGGFMPLGVAYAYALKGSAPAPVAEPEFIAPPAPACTGRNSEPTRRAYSGYPATEAQVRFVKILLEERDWEHAIRPDSGNGEAIALLGEGEEISKQEASSLISTLKDLPKSQDLSAPEPKTSQKHSQPWKALAEKVPAGNYCVTDSDGKRHFYRVSVSDRGFYKVQERASEELHFVPLVRYAGILQSILDEGVEKARLAYSTHKKRCWHCGTRLTDNTGNPHYSRGLGPKCGDEH